jgi:phage repressor protein C with HTH and peptisase S24 domain
MTFVANVKILFLHASETAGEVADMLTHKAIWRGIDLLAERNRLSASGLAKRAGLDPTTFNKSKRITKQGKSRWPSTESLSKILDATATSMGDFVGLIAESGEGSPAPARRVRCLSLSQMEREPAFDAAGFPQAGPWEDIEFPSISDDNAYAVELDRDVMPPVLRAGDMLIISPKSSVRRHDRIILRHRDGEVGFGVLLRRTAQRVTLGHFARPEEQRAVDAAEVAWLARILWISQ